jgi:hypothetical protein
MIQIIRAIAILGIAATVAAPAMAADLLRRSPAALAEPLPPAPVGTTWSGFYVGGMVLV